MDEEDEEWDMAAIDELEKKAQEANAARRASQAYSSLPNNPFAAPSPSATFLAPPATQSFGATNVSAHLGEPQKLQDVLLEKDGAISLLRSRLKQTEQELYELRSRLSTQASVWPTTQQQREVEHLSSQLMLKDQEIIEVKRVCAEKEERVKSAIHTAAALQQEVETLKRRRETFENKSCQERDQEFTNYSWESKEPLSGCNPEKKHATLDAHRGQNSSKDLDNQWVTPWSSQNVDKATSNMPVQKPLKDSLEMPTKSVSINLSKRNCLDLGLGSSKISSHLEPLDLPSLDERSETRFFANGGCALLSEKSKWLPCNEVENHELVVREPTVVRHQSKDREPPAARAHIHPQHSGPFSEIDEGTADIAHTMDTIWKTKNAKDVGSDLVGKVFAYCQPQLHMLFKFDGSQNLLEQMSHEKDAKANKKRTVHEHMVVEGGSGVSLKFRCALASVANGLASTVTLLGPLIEFCSHLDHAELVQSSICIISCIVQHDRSCREKLLGRPSLLQSMEVGNYSKTFSKKMNVKIDGSGWFIVDTEKCLADSSLTVSDQSIDGGGLFFSSQRIVCRLNQVSVKAGVKVHAPYFLDGQSKHEAGDGEESKGTETVAQDYVGGACDSCFFLSWALQLAISSTSPGIRCETLTMMGCLLMHTEPLIERAQFASILFNERLFLLWKKGAGVLVQLRTLKLVHLLLHCPDTLNRVCQEKGTKEDLDYVASGGGQESHFKADQRFVNLAAIKQRPERLDTIEHHSESTKGRVEVTGHSIELLEGLATCISFTGVSMQEYALRRLALRTLAFIATSGDTGTKFLLQSIPSINSENDGMSTKEGQQGEQKKGPLSCSSKKVCDERLGQLQVDSNDPAKMSRPSGPILSDGKATDTHETKDQVYSSQNIPYLLVTLIDSELSIEEEQAAGTTSTERASLILEALKLLCRLASHALHSSAVVALFTKDKSTLRTCVNVMNRLIRWGSQIDASQNLPNSSASVPDVADLAKSLRKKMVAGATL